jgi:hypothetical protein
VWLCICWWHKTIWQKQWSNSNETVMQQWCLWFYFQAFEVWLCFLWWHKTFWQTQWSNSDATVMPFDFGSFISFARFWDVIDRIVSCCKALGVCLKNSDQTVIRQWWNSDQTVMPLIWAFYYYCQGFEMSWIIFYPFAMPWECVWWDKTFWQKQWSNSD